MRLPQKRKHPLTTHLIKLPQNLACFNEMNSHSSKFVQSFLVRHLSIPGISPVNLLRTASRASRLECVMQLVQAGVGVNITTSRFAQTPAHIAAFGGHPQGLLWLIQVGADYNIQDVVGESPVHKAARSGSLDCLNVLVSHGAKTDLRNANGLTAAELALAQGFHECSQFLCSVQNHQLNGFYTNGIASGLYRDNLITDGLNGYTRTSRKRSHEESEHCGIKKPRNDDMDGSNYGENLVTNQLVTNGSFHSSSLSPVGVNISIGGSELTGGFGNAPSPIYNGSGFQPDGAAHSAQPLWETCGSLHHNGSPGSCVAGKPMLPSCYPAGSLEDHDPLQYGHYHGFGDTAESIPDLNSILEHSSSIKVEQSYNNAVYSAVHLFHGS
ncbi:ankyrin repeat domain-containing protein 10-like isoform X2 [Scyliorhinus torazame]|uniref:ankyrin repeat domain-containing protein 10-like isoform X2 n=1 Tax=Scyliorhinus torazame TaxID=75743 RepID=UPI003B58FC82